MRTAVQAKDPPATPNKTLAKTPRTLLETTE
jgi:hypothetical protein